VSEPAVRIGVFGAPLVGKSTLLRRLAESRPGSTVTWGDAELRPFPNSELTPRNLTCSIARGGRHFQLQCLPGGTLPDWAPRELADVTRGVLVLDPQVAYAERQSTFVEAALRTLAIPWSVVVTKQDFVRHPQIPLCDPVPASLSGCPVLRLSLIGDDAAERIGRFFDEHVLIAT
jgi:hypothetical protein